MKTSYLIDGYNLLHAMGVLLGREEGPQVLEKARRMLLDDLARAFGTDTGLLTVVFDAAVQPRRSQAEQTFQGIRVLFAVGGQEADDMIEKLIVQHPHPRHLAVVSDDHRLQRAARRRQAHDMSCDAFLDLLEERQQQGAGPQPHSVSAEDARQAPVSQAETAHWLAEFGHLQKDLDRQDRITPLEKLPPLRNSKK